MLSVIRKTVKAFVSPETIHLVKDRYDRLMFNALARIELNTENLATSSAVDIDGFMLSHEAESSWAMDSLRIRQTFGDHERRGGINPGERRALYYFVRSLKPKTVLEIGTFVGASTLHIGMAMKSNGAGHLTTVDIVDTNSNWKSLGLPRPTRETAELLQCGELIDFVVSSSQDYMLHTKDRFDLVFLDGDHRASSVYEELSIALEVLNKNGLILLHDYMPSGALFPGKDAWIAGPHMAMLRAAKETDIYVIPFLELPWETRYGERKTSLAVVTRLS